MTSPGSPAGIRLVDVGKQYRRGVRRVGYRTLRETLVENAQKLLTRPAGDKRDAAFFWALRDVSFDVPKGSTLGVIGPNGAGKSTLLKILSRVTEPTRGEVHLCGRVGSLLEVGTGFHPELTGRENVMLNGAILGMKRREILAKFDDIVAFAEVAPFIDTPVKHYSSGMYLRLAFAVAAHLEPEILLVDEVLAVGDAAFQKRCLGKMSDVAREGRTIIFVSHNLDAVRRLCSHAVMLEQGRVAALGDTATVVAGYLSREYNRPFPGTRIPLAGAARTGTGAARFTAVTYRDGGRGTGNPCSEGPLEMALEIESDALREVRSLAVFLTEPYGTKVLNADTLHTGRSVTLQRGSNQVILRIPALHLIPGVYRVGLWLADPVQAQSISGAYDYIESAFEIEVAAGVGAISGAGGIVTCGVEIAELP